MRHCETCEWTEVIQGDHEAILEFLVGCDADLAQDGTGEFAKNSGWRWK
jgi:hypothetical protein